MKKTKGSAPCIMVNIDDLLYTINEVIENDDDPILFVEMFRCLAIYGTTREDSDSVPRSMKPYYRLLRKTIESGFESFDAGQIESAYGGFKSTETTRIQLQKGLTKQEAEKHVMPIEEWWAKHDRYTDEIGKGRRWYESARAIHEKISAGIPDPTQVYPTGVNNIIESENNKIQSNVNKVEGHGQVGLPPNKQFRIHDKYGGQNFPQKMIDINKLDNLIGEEE